MQAFALCFFNGFAFPLFFHLVIYAIKKTVMFWYVALREAMAR